MKVATLESALGVVKRYGVATRPGRYPLPGTSWMVRIDGCTFRTSKGEEITTNFWAPCQMPNGAESYLDRSRIASEETRRGQEQLAQYLLRVFEKKRGFPGYRGWFQCVELVSVYDPIRRKFVMVDHSRRK